MNILVTGGAGYIGSVTAKALLDRGHSVVVYDNLSTGFREAISPDAKFVFGDVRDESLVRRILKDQKIEAVIHFAAKLIVPESVTMPLEYYDVNVRGGLAVLRGCADLGIDKFVFSSTAAVYGDAGDKPVDEDATLRPLNPYGASKAMMEQILRDVGGPQRVRHVSLRYFNVAGASDDLSLGLRSKGATHLVKVSAEAACGKRPEVAIFGDDYPTKDGTGIRDYVHVVDLAEAHVKALGYLSEGGTSTILNCGYGRGFSVKEVIETMRSVSGVDFNVRHAPRRPGDGAALVADSNRLRSRLGWQPRHDDLSLICRSAYEWEKKLG